MVNFVDQHRSKYGVEPICKELQIAPSTYFRHVQLRDNPNLRSTRAKRDDALKTKIQVVWDESGKRYGAMKVWQQLCLDGVDVARCTVERLMGELGFQGVTRGKRTNTTRPSKRPCPKDLVQRNFRAAAPNRLWVADITCIHTRTGIVYASFVTDVFSRRIVGWQVASSMKTSLALDSLEQALSERQTDDRLIHHSDRGAQYLSIRYTKRLQNEGIRSSVGSVGDSYDNALAESLIGLYKTEVIEHQGPWEGLKDVERATLEWVHWFNTKRLHGALGYVSPQKYEEEHLSRHANQQKAA
jgi:transposase InsO family protein